MFGTVLCIPDIIVEPYVITFGSYRLYIAIFVFIFHLIAAILLTLFLHQSHPHPHHLNRV